MLPRSRHATRRDVPPERQLHRLSRTFDRRSPERSAAVASEGGRRAYVDSRASAPSRGWPSRSRNLRGEEPSLPQQDEPSPPYLCRFSIVSLFTCPSVWPLPHASRIAAVTAAQSRRRPAANARKSLCSLRAAARAIHMPSAATSRALSWRPNSAARSRAAAIGVHPAVRRVTYCRCSGVSCAAGSTSHQRACRGEGGFAGGEGDAPGAPPRRRRWGLAVGQPATWCCTVRAVPRNSSATSSCHRAFASSYNPRPTAHADARRTRRAC
jgi:hypothetical protein